MTAHKRPQKCDNYSNCEWLDANTDDARTQPFTIANKWSKNFVERPHRTRADFSWGKMVMWQWPVKSIAVSYSSAVMPLLRIRCRLLLMTDPFCCIHCSRDFSIGQSPKLPLLVGDFDPYLIMVSWAHESVSKMVSRFVQLFLHSSSMCPKHTPYYMQHL